MAVRAINIKALGLLLKDSFFDPRSVGFPPQSPTGLGGFSSTHLDRLSLAFPQGIFKGLFSISRFSSPVPRLSWEVFHRLISFLSCSASRPFSGRSFGFPPPSPVRVGRFFIDRSSWFSSSVSHWVWEVFHQLRKRVVFSINCLPLSNTYQSVIPSAIFTRSAELAS